jgi:hypothetical protein
MYGGLMAAAVPTGFLRLLEIPESIVVRTDF